MFAYVLVESIETRAQVPMIVQGQHTRMRTEPEGAKRSSQSEEFYVQLFRMSPFGGYQMPQRRGSRVHCVQDPKLCNIASEEFGPAVRIALPDRHRLLLQDFHQPATEKHQPLAGVDLKHWRNEMWIVGEVT